MLTKNKKTTKLMYISWKWQKLFLFQFFFSLFLSLQGHQWTMINHNFIRSTQKFFLHTSFCHHINNTGFSFPFFLFFFIRTNNGFFSSSNCCFMHFQDYHINKSLYLIARQVQKLRKKINPST